MTTLKTRRLTLRQPTPEDAAPIALYLNNFAVAGNLATVPYPYRVADAEVWLNCRCTSNPDHEADFGIELREAGYVGQVGFHLTEGEPELGYWLGEPYWHRGIMTEAASAVIAWYFSATDAKTIRCGAFYFNKASLAVQKKLGFVETGTSRRHCLARGEQVRHIDTQLSRTDWVGSKS